MSSSALGFFQSRFGHSLHKEQRAAEKEKKKNKEKMKKETEEKKVKKEQRKNTGKNR